MDYCIFHIIAHKFSSPLFSNTNCQVKYNFRIDVKRVTRACDRERLN